MSARSQISDGVFATAITLLVLTFELPPALGDLGTELRDRAGELVAYALSFAVLGKLWLAHHRFLASVERFDGTLLGLNLLYLACIALIPLTTDLLANHSGEPLAVIAYALNLAISLGLPFSIRYAWRRDRARVGEPLGS